MGGRVTPEMDVLVADDRIQQIGHKLPRPKGARVVDGTKRFLVPGLWDMHVHTAGLSANPEWSRDALLPLLVANGVTGIRDMGGSLAALQTWKRKISQGDLVGPQIVRAGPMLDGYSDDPSVIAVQTQTRLATRLTSLRLSMWTSSRSCRAWIEILILLQSPRAKLSTCRSWDTCLRWLGLPRHLRRGRRVLSTSCMEGLPLPAQATKKNFAEKW